MPAIGADPAQHHSDGELVDVGGGQLRYDDWGERTPRWAGIRSETVDVRGAAAHLLRADPRPGRDRGRNGALPGCRPVRRLQVAAIKSRYTDPDRLSTRINTASGGDPSRCSREFFALLSEQLGELSSRPGRMDASVLAFASVLDAILIDQRPTLATLQMIKASALVMWGHQDPFIEQPMVDQIAELRPDWNFQRFAGAGHLLPVELPDEYVTTVGTWLASRQ